MCSDWLLSGQDFLVKTRHHQLGVQGMYSLCLTWYWTSMLWSIDSCQKRVSADQCHMTVSRANYLLLVLIDCSLNYFLCFILIVLNRPYNKWLINLTHSVITGKSQTLALMYPPRYNCKLSRYIKALVWDIPVLTLLLVNEWYIILMTINIRPET